MQLLLVLCHLFLVASVEGEVLDSCLSTFCMVNLVSCLASFFASSTSWDQGMVNVN